MYNCAEKYTNGLFALPVSICCLPVTFTAVHYFRHSVILFAMAVSGFATAADSTRNSALSAIYEHSGLHSHLSSVYETVVNEIRLARQKCENHQNNDALEMLLESSLSTDALRRDFLDQLDQRISDEHLEKIVSWAQSDAGKNIHQAELESIELNEGRFESLLITYQQSEIHGDERNARLNRMLEHTGAVYFLSAFNTELSALVSIASVCSGNQESLAAARKKIEEDRGSEALYRTFMRRELLIPSAVVYRNISNAQLDALSAFASSDAGGAYFAALINGTRSLLASKVDRLSEMLETIPEKID